MLSRVSSLLSKPDRPSQEKHAHMNKLNHRTADISSFPLDRGPSGTQGHNDSPHPSTGESPELEERHEKQGDSSSD